MDVIVDGVSDFAVQGEPANILAVVGAVSDFLRKQGRAILAIDLDGEAITPDEMVKRLEGAPLDSANTLNVSSEDIAKLLEDCLKELDETLPELPVACRSLAEVFQGETPEDGYEPFNRLAEIWAHVKNRELLIAHALGIDLGKLDVNGKSVNTLYEELNERLNEAVEALEQSDCVLLGDLLEYELAPRAEREMDIVSALQSRAAANPN